MAEILLSKRQLAPEILQDFVKEILKNRNQTAVLTTIVYQTRFDEGGDSSVDGLTRWKMRLHFRIDIRQVTIEPGFRTR